jgi:membrane fusion protein (multidrug efflux system)
MIIMLIAVAIVLGGIFGYKMFAGMMMKKYMMAAGMPPQSVSTTKATMQDWLPRLVAVGTLRAVNGADISSEVSGIVEQIRFDSGNDVDAGSILVQLRAQDDIAKLVSLQSEAQLAEITYDRDMKQLKAQAVSQATVDTDEANLNSIRAQVAEQQAIVNKKTIRAPFAGHLGIRTVDIGQYLNAGTAVVSLQQLDPIYVDFALPEQALTQIKTGQKVKLTTDAHAGKTFDGTISSINSKVDETTRNIQVRATLKNPEHLLLPGLFANVEIAAGEPQHLITLPQTAVVFNTYGSTIYLVKHKDGDDSDKNLTVQQSVIITGETRGDQIAIMSGVNEGDEVVTSGQVKLRNGTPITINNDIQPANDPDPTPHEQ